MVKSKSGFSACLRIISLLLALFMFAGLLDIKADAAAPKLSGSTMTVAVGETRSLTLKNATGTVKWSSSDKDVATVKNGKVTGKSTGTATISATYKSKTYKCKVTVKEYRLYAKTTKMDVGDKQTLKLKGKTDGKTIKWSTSDKSVLKVSSKGKVTAVGAGTATVYAKIGSKKYSKKITVSPVFNDTGKNFNIHVWNTEFIELFENFYPGYEKVSNYSGDVGDVKINFILTATVDDDYDNTVYHALLDDGEDAVDLFLVEEDNSHVFFANPFVLPLAEVGITSEDTKYMYKCTTDVGTYEDKLMGAAWQVNPGGFVYRRSIAKDVLCTDDPEMVQNYLSSWTKFETTAEKMKKKGYYMVSNTDVMSKPFFYNEADRFVDGNEIALNDNMRDWLAISKRFYDKGYCTGSDTWSYNWSMEQAEGSKVFGFFYSTWGVDFTLPGNSLSYDYSTDEFSNDGLYGDWALVEGPENFTWGGSYICVGANCDNRELAGDIIRTLCCDYKTMLKIAQSGEGIYPNHKKVMNKMADKGIKNDFLGGQNSWKIFAEIAKGCRIKEGVNLYDAYFYYDYSYYYVFKDYFSGEISYEDAMEMYYEIMYSKYPELYVPDKIPSEPK